jgi:hypothetical protein
MVTVNDILNKVEPESYYVVDFRVMDKPELFKNEFETEDEALTVVEKYLKFDLKNYPVIKGIDAIRHNIPFRSRKSKVGPDGIVKNGYIRALKYDYPAERVHKQKRKTWRTIQRRKQRKNKLK